MTTLLTPRLRLVPMADTHLQGLFEMNREPEVMRYITGKPDTIEDTQAMIDRVKARWAEWGYSWWTFFERDTGQIVGAGCVQHLGRDQALPHELGWRLRPDRWSRGYASEAARRMAAFAFDDLRAPQLVAFCDQENAGSSHVMEKLGMRFRGIEHWYDFDGAVYGMTVDEWRACPASSKAAQEIAAVAGEGRSASAAQSPPTK
ncbi:N-acetyltransferase [Roseateles aquatilis]|uniref:N-acetyltransferase n=1 Tax=Roseateles aquatilis TaxID=431061 RepID=A0A246JHG4_9BURK|nr:GNAT family N-acetyltransferase [Roseateles aquatilis]OWQ92077.1 N-acetyltransferase [Roseateles aquatilis]